MKFDKIGLFIAVSEGLELDKVIAKITGTGIHNVRTSITRGSEGFIYGHYSLAPNKPELPFCLSVTCDNHSYVLLTLHNESGHPMRYQMPEESISPSVLIRHYGKLLEAAHSVDCDYRYNSEIGLVGKFEPVGQKKTES